MNAFTGNEDTFNSREAIERIDELTAEFVDSTDSDPAANMRADYTDYEFMGSTYYARS